MNKGKFSRPLTAVEAAQLRLINIPISHLYTPRSWQLMAPASTIIQQ